MQSKAISKSDSGLRCVGLLSHSLLIDSHSELRNSEQEADRRPARAKTWEGMTR